MEMWRGELCRREGEGGKGAQELCREELGRLWGLERRLEGRGWGLILPAILSRGLCAPPSERTQTGEEMEPVGRPPHLPHPSGPAPAPPQECSPASEPPPPLGPPSAHLYLGCSEVSEGDRSGMDRDVEDRVVAMDAVVASSKEGGVQGRRSGRPVGRSQWGPMGARLQGLLQQL